MTRERLPDSGAEALREARVTDPPSLVIADWIERFPWLVQGTTTRRARPGAFDFGLFSDGSPELRVRANWDELGASTGMARMIHARQVHGDVVRAHHAGPPGLEIVEPCDGHVTADAGVLLAVTTADCVPVFIVDPGRRAVGVVHAGWRGAAAGVVESALAVLAGQLGVPPTDLHAHLGPAICGECYEVGPEVFEALDEPVPAQAEPLDLRRALARRLKRAGVPPEQLSISGHCTRCTDSDLFSHRGGDAERQVGYIGLRP